MRSVFLVFFIAVTSLPSFAQAVGYGFVNRKGTEIMALNPDTTTLKGEVALRFQVALCDGGRLFNILYSEKQPSGPRDTQRAIAANFDQYGGFVFRIDRGRAEPDGNCLLASPSFLEQKELLSLTVSAKPAAPPPCDDATRKSLPALDDRDPKSCAVIARSGNDVQVLAIEYQPAGGRLLGAIALKTQSATAIHKFPADKGDSSWKVGDGGVWDPSSLRPLFVLRLPDGEYDLGVVWSGTEGASLHLMRSAGPGMTDRSVGYRYWLPK